MKAWYRRLHVRMFGPAHIGATNTRRPGDDMRNAGQDPLLAAQVAIHQQVSAVMLEEERRRVELAEIEAATKAEIEAIFAPWQAGIEVLFAETFHVAEQLAGLDADTCHGWYLDAVRIAAEAEAFAREATSGDIFATQELDMREFRRQLRGTAEALLIS